MLRKLLLALFLTLCSVAGAQAANCATTAFANRSGGGNWSATGASSVWVTTSGGATQCDLVAGNNVVFDANTAAGTYTMDASISINSLDTDGVTSSPAVVWAQNATTLTVSGNDAGAVAGQTFRLVSGLTYSGAAINRVITFTSTSGTSTITFGGKSLGSINFNGAGGTFAFADAASTVATGVVTLTAGTLDNSGNFAVSFGLFSSTGSTARALNAGTNTWTLTGTTGSVWEVTGTNLTLTSAPGTLLISATGTGNRIVNLGQATTCGGSPCNYNVVTFNGSTSGYYISLSASASNTIATWNLNAPMRLRGPSNNTTITVTNALTWAGTANNNVINVIGDTAVLTINAPASTLNWTAMGNVTFSNASTANNSFNLGGVTGLTVNTPGGGRCIGC